VRRFRNSVIVNLAIHKLHNRQPSSTLLLVACITHNIAYVILEARTSLLPISRSWISNCVSPSLVVLFVPQIRTTCTSPILASNGIKLNAIILSSLNKRSVLTYRPHIRTTIIASANPVHHHETRRVGLSCIFVLGGGALEYLVRGRSIISEECRPPTSKEG